MKGKWLVCACAVLCAGLCAAPAAGAAEVDSPPPALENNMALHKTAQAEADGALTVTLTVEGGGSLRQAAGNVFLVVDGTPTAAEAMAVKSFIGTLLGEADHLSVGLVRTDGGAAVPLAKLRGTGTEAVDKLRRGLDAGPGSALSLEECLRLASRQLAGAQAGPRHIVLISTGAAPDAGEDAAALARSLCEGGTVTSVMAVGVGAQPARACACRSGAYWVPPGTGAMAPVAMALCQQAQNAVVTDALAPGMTYVDGSVHMEGGVSAAVDGDRLTWALGVYVPAGAPLRLCYQVRASAAPQQPVQEAALGEEAPGLLTVPGGEPAEPPAAGSNDGAPGQPLGLETRLTWQDLSSDGTRVARTLLCRQPVVHFAGVPQVPAAESGALEPAELPSPEPPSPAEESAGTLDDLHAASLAAFACVSPPGTAPAHAPAVVVLRAAAGPAFLSGAGALWPPRRTEAPSRRRWLPLCNAAVGLLCGGSSLWLQGRAARGAPR